MQMCAGALSDPSHLATASAAFKAAAAVLQIITDDNERSAFHSILPQMLQVSHATCWSFIFGSDILETSALCRAVFTLWELFVNRSRFLSRFRMCTCMASGLEHAVLIISSFAVVGSNRFVSSFGRY